MNFINLFTLLAVCGLGLSLPDHELPTDFDVASLKGPNSQTDGSIGNPEDELLARTEHEVEDAMTKFLVVDDHEITSIDEMNNMISSLEKDMDFEEVKDKRGSGIKRQTVDFMGTQVSYPQYLRLVKLQEKVVKLSQMIEALHSRYSQDLLDNLPQYHRLMKLHESLLPLLSSLNIKQQEMKTVYKRSPFSVDFLGLTISYPQYLRLKLLQEKVIKLDKLLSHLSSVYPSEILESNPKWQSLRSLHSSLKKLLPPEYVTQYTQVSQQKSRNKRSVSVDFNGMFVSYPQYIRLMRLQEKVLKLDRILRKLAEKRDPRELAENAKWLELLSLRQSLQNLLPAFHPTFEVNPVNRVKRSIRPES